MRILYVDCFSGISGDMTVGALTDLGITPSTFEWELSKLDLGDCHLHFERQTRAGISGIKFDVHSGATHHSSQDDDPTQATDHAPVHPAHPGQTGEPHDHAHHDHVHHDHPSEDRDHHGNEPNPPRGFSEIRALIEGSELSDFVKQHVTSIFRRIASAESKIHGTSIE